MKSYRTLFALPLGGRHAERACYFIILLLTGVVGQAAPPVPLDHGAAGLREALAALQTTGSVLHVVAHPDDEDGPMLAYMARKEAARTMLFCITRGEGGANLISADFFDALGILRTLEHQQAARWYGNELFYSHAVDYGFSKTLEEANRQWQDGEPILRDLVRVIRKHRPDVIVSRFRGDFRDGHGHHQMAGVLSRRAFEVAADPDIFPEQIRVEGLRPWQPRKLYVGNINPRWRSEDAGFATIELETGEYNPLFARSYAQIARYGLGYQRSQGISGHEGPGGPRLTRYRLAETSVGEAAVPEHSFFQGLDVSISGLTGFGELAGTDSISEQLAGIEQSVQQAVDRFSAEKGEACVPPLLEGLQRTRRLLEQLTGAEPGNFEITERLRIKEKQFEKALARALALEVTATALAGSDDAANRPFAASSSGFNHAVPGQSCEIEVRLVNPSSYAVLPAKIELEAPDGWLTGEAAYESTPLATLDEITVRVPVTIPEDAEPTRPYWQRESIAEPFYQLRDARDAGRPFPHVPLRAVVMLDVQNVLVRLDQPVQVAIRHPEFGQVEYPLTVVPKVGVRFTNKYGVVPLAKRVHSVRIQLRSAAKEPIEGMLRLELPSGWSSVPEEVSFRLVKEDEEAIFGFDLRLPEGLAGGEEFSLQAVATSSGREYREGYRTITARDLDRFNLYTNATHLARVVDLRVPPDLQLGYVMGSGDDVPEALAGLDLAPTMLDEKELATGDLNRFDTILIGVRAYAVREDLRTHNRRLLDYVYNGGNLLVQYQTPEFDQNFGPYPYRMGRRPQEVSEEDAEVTLLEPGHPLFKSPNQITLDDFSGWVEQRGSKFWNDWDSRYTPLLECHDAGQEPQRGGMLVAEYGKGTYIYSAYAWYRQLPHGVGGAYRVFANLISWKRGE